MVELIDPSLPVEATPLTTDVDALSILENAAAFSASQIPDVYKVLGGELSKIYKDTPREAEDTYRAFQLFAARRAANGNPDTAFQELTDNASEHLEQLALVRAQKSTGNSNPIAEQIEQEKTAAQADSRRYLHLEDRGQQPETKADAPTPSIEEQQTASTKKQQRKALKALEDQLVSRGIKRDDAKNHYLYLELLQTFNSDVTRNKVSSDRSMAATNLNETESIKPASRSKTLLKMGTKIVALSLAISITQQAFATPSKSNKAPTEATPHSIDPIPSTTTTPTPEQSTTTRPEIPMADKPFEIIPPASFLTPEGNFIQEDYRISIDAIDADIKVFSRPQSEFTKIGELNQTVIDTLAPAEHPTQITPQVAAHKLTDPHYIPTAERVKRSNGDMWYWGNKTAGEYQKTGIHINRESVYPGQLGNSVIILHGSTKTAGGGDLPALKTGDSLTLRYPKDNNTYNFEFVEREMILVDKDGMLLESERQRLANSGYDQSVTADSVSKNYANFNEKDTLPTLTMVICSDKEGTPGGDNGNGAAEARALYRFKLTSQDIKLRYPAS